MHINEIVFTQGLYDAGLCIGKENGLPIIHGRYNRFSDAIYGCVDSVEWLASGVYCTKDKWDKMTNQSMGTQDIMSTFGIKQKDLVKTPCVVENTDLNEGQLTTFLSNNKYVKRNKGAKLAKQLMTEFCVISANVVNNHR